MRVFLYIISFRRIQLAFCGLYFFILASCNHNRIETDESLTVEDEKYIRSLGLLDEDEHIIKFYSEYKKKVAGNFFTKKRLAKYWIDERCKDRDQVSFSYYNDIASIDTVFNAGLTYCPYMLVRKKDNTQFRVSVDGDRAEVKSFFEEVLQAWKSKVK